MTPPIDAAEFDAQKDLIAIITQFLCRNKDKGFSADEIAQSTGITLTDVTNALLRQSLSDVAKMLTGRRNRFTIEDVTVNGIVYYRCKLLE